MGILDKILKRKKKSFEEDESQSAVFVMQLLFEEPCEMPEMEQMNSILQKHMGEVKNFSYDDKMAAYAVMKYEAEFQDAVLPPQVMIMGCNEFDASKIGELERNQMWNCEESEEILASCKYQVFVSDMMAAALEYKERAELNMDFLEALVELFPQCKAVYFHNSGKLFTAQAIREHDIPREYRFIYFAVNVRFFNVQETEDMVIDSLGMRTLYLPDVQYHFHDMEPNWVMNHAYDVVSYIFDNANPIKNGDPIDSIVDGAMNREIMWRCQYEEAMIQPKRLVIDIYMNEYAAGGR